MLQSSLKAVGSKYPASPEVSGSSQYPYVIWELEYEGFCLSEYNAVSEQQGQECCFESKKSVHRKKTCFEFLRIYFRNRQFQSKGIICYVLNVKKF